MSMKNRHYWSLEMRSRLESDSVVFLKPQSMFRLKLRMFSFFHLQILARRIKQVTMSHNTKSSKYVFQNGQYLGDYYKKSKFFLSESVKGRSIYHTVEELAVSIQGHYQVSTYKLTMTEKHYNSNLKSIFDSLIYRVFRNVEPSPPKARVDEIRANLRSEYYRPVFFFYLSQNVKYPTSKLMSVNQC